MSDSTSYPLRATVLRRLIDESYDPNPIGPGAVQDVAEFGARFSDALDLGYITPAQFRSDLLSDLNYLLQTTRLSTRPLGVRYPELKSSIYNYGLPDRASFGYSETDLSRLASEISVALRVFEPRLKRIQVESSEVEVADSVAVFGISAALRIPPRVEAVRLAASLPVHSKVLKVTEQSAPRDAQSLQDVYFADSDQSDE